MITSLSVQNNSLFNAGAHWILVPWLWQGRIRRDFEEWSFPWREISPWPWREKAEGNFTKLEKVTVSMNKGWRWPKRWRGKKKEIFSGFLPLTLTPPTGLFFCTFLFRKYLWFYRNKTTHNKTTYKTSQLTPSTKTPTFLLLRFSRAEINCAVGNLGEIYVGLRIWRAELQKRSDWNLLRTVHSRDQKPHPGSAQATAGLFTTARGYPERTESRGDKSVWAEWKQNSC